jgi:hypothetical protein
VQQVGEVEFCIDKDVITVSELSSAKEHHADFFLHHIDRLHTISDELGKQTTQASQKMK